MSRLRNVTRSLASGYVGMAWAVLYTLASVPLALHYLSKSQFGLWALVVQIAGYLALIDLGMSASISRILIDHKDHPDEGTYGSVIQTGIVVLLVQGFCIAVGGWLLSFWLPSLMDIEPELADTFRILVAAQCGLLGIFFVSRIWSHILQAHQRFDIINYSQMGQLTLSYIVQWVAFHQGLGLYSLLWAAGVSFLFGLLSNMLLVLRLGLLPARNRWGRASLARFREIFAFGNELFLLTLGLQLLNASQVVIISRTLGLNAAAVWTIATKTFALAQQFVSRIFDFSATALGEMIVRGERERLQHRFRHVVQVTAIAAVFVGLVVGSCNGPFLAVWTKGRISWPAQNDALMALLLILVCVTRCHVGFTGSTKQIGRLRYIYFLEGITFVLAAFACARQFGMTGIIVAAIVCNIAWSGIFGLRQTAHYLALRPSEVAFGWLSAARNYFLLLGPLSLLLWWATSSMGPLARLLINAGVLVLAGGPLFWFVALTDELRHDFRSGLRRLLRSSDPVVPTA